MGLPSISLTKVEVKVERTNPLESVGDIDVGGSEDDEGEEDE